MAPLDAIPMPLAKCRFCNGCRTGESPQDATIRILRGQSGGSAYRPGSGGLVFGGNATAMPRWVILVDGFGTGAGLPRSSSGSCFGIIHAPCDDGEQLPCQTAGTAGVEQVSSMVREAHDHAGASTRG
jgi:hypothetical protein